MKFAALLLILCATGCSSTPPAKFYALSTHTAPSGAAVAQSATLGLRIGPFTFPDYLARPNVVTRASDGGLDIAEFERWGGSLENDLHRVLASSLSARLATGRVSIYPADLRFTPDYIVTGEIIALDGQLGGNVVLDVHWIIGDGKHSGAALSVQHSVVSATAAGAEYAALVAAHGQVVEQLSAEIAAEITRLQALP